MASNDDSGCGRIAMIVGAIAAVVTIFVFVTGKPSLPEFLGARQGNPTQVSSVPFQSSGQAVIPTPSPSETILPTRRPTETTIPTPMPPPDTQSGTILEIGQTWRQGGVELLLAETELGPKFILTIFRLTNMGSERAFRFGHENFSAYDNRNRRLRVGGATGVQSYEQLIQDCQPETVILAPQASTRIEFRCDYLLVDSDVAIEVDVADSSITEITIVASGISSIDNARWRIPIQH